MTVDEVADLCRVTRMVLQIEMHHSHLAYSRENGEIVITRDQMNSWVERRRERIKAHHACRRSNRRAIAWQNRVRKAEAANLLPVELASTPDSVGEFDPFEN